MLVGYARRTISLAENISYPSGLFEAKKTVTPTGIEPVIFGMKARRPRPLDDGAYNFVFIIKNNKNLAISIIA